MRSLTGSDYNRLHDLLCDVAALRALRTGLA